MLKPEETSTETNHEEDSVDRVAQGDECQTEERPKAPFIPRAFSAEYY